MRTSLRRPLAVSAAVGTAAHNAFELGSGVGLVWQPELGLAGALALWGVQLPAWITLAARGERRWDNAVAVLSGTALAGMIVHFTIWPWQRGPLGLPVLVAYQGLSDRQLSFYNAILAAWGLAAAGALVVEAPQGTRRWGLVGLATLPLLRRSASHHFAWATQQARDNPAWWNRSLK